MDFSKILWEFHIEYTTCAIKKVHRPLDYCEVSTNLLVIVDVSECLQTCEMGNTGWKYSLMASDNNCHVYGQVTIFVGGM